VVIGPWKAFWERENEAKTGRRRKAPRHSTGIRESEIIDDDPMTLTDSTKSTEKATQD
jgi:hypothetical protein